MGVAPPTIVLFVNSTRLFDPTYQRYLLNTFREKLPFRDIPIKLYMRSKKPMEPGASSAPEVWQETETIVNANSSGQRADRPIPAHQGGHFDVGTRFLNHEVNELLSDLEG